jgi:ribonuclease R
MEIEIAVREYGVPHEFSISSMKEAAALPDEVCEEDLEGRVDLRDIPLVTIDGEDAKYFDDAVYCEPMQYKRAECFRLIVAIR